MEEPLRIAVCEDSAEDEQILLDILSKADIPSIPTVYRSGEELLEHYTLQTFDLLLSDIYMSGMTGVDAVAGIRQLDPELPIAFVTSSLDFTLESYRLSVLMYIEKPYDPSQIANILHLAKIKRDSDPALVRLVNGREQRIRFSRIIYLEQQTHHVVIHTKYGAENSVYDKLSVLLPQLEPRGFYSPHKSYCVNLEFVKSIDPELRCFRMVDDSQIPIRRESMHQARAQLEAFLFQKARGNET